ncbi:hypothetical protein KL86DPRO_11383 [uncultured delta proteobacterium]|uniref:Uncharacterized protein n=1 Tax=uncultured delta proteobacterium TaxID=34034 RepID=A0A212JG34_9DELT|nr:hypothetical protein KL86DPRO_11383 [uncultured delta proteobacterium]
MYSARVRGVRAARRPVPAAVIPVFFMIRPYGSYMYINLILGVVALVVVWLFLKKLLVKDDTLRENPAELLEKEVARRRAQEEELARAFERLRGKGKERMRPVVAALEEMRSAMPSLAGSAGAAQKALDWDDEGDSVMIRVHGREEGDAASSLAVSWRVPDLDLQKAARFGDDLPGAYILRRSDTGREEVVSTLDACVRGITSFIVDFMA